MNWLRRFLSAVRPEVYIDGTGARAEGELVLRTAQRAEECRLSMGTRWCAHPANFVLSPKQRARLAENAGVQKINVKRKA